MNQKQWGTNNRETWVEMTDKYVNIDGDEPLMTTLSNRYRIKPELQQKIHLETKAKNNYFLEVSIAIYGALLNHHEDWSEADGTWWSSRKTLDFAQHFLERMAASLKNMIKRWVLQRCTLYITVYISSKWPAKGHRSWVKVWSRDFLRNNLWLNCNPSQQSLNNSFLIHFG